MIEPIFPQTAPAIEWEMTAGGIAADRADELDQTADGGYIIAGSSNSLDGDVTGNHGMQDGWVVKIASNGSLEWQKSLGGSLNDFVLSVQETNDGGFIMAGGSGSSDGDVTLNQGFDDYWIVKTDISGALQWQRTFGGTGMDNAHSIRQTSDGGYIVAGDSNSGDGDVSGNHGDLDVWVLKLDGAGNIEWQKALGGTHIDRGRSIEQTSDGGYILGGASHSIDWDVTGNHGDQDLWVVKLDGTGNLQWQRSLGGSAYEGEYSVPVQQTDDGGYIVACGTMSNDGDVTGNHGENDCWVIKLDPSGSILWQHAMGGSDSDHATSIEQTDDGGYVMAGWTFSVDGDVSGHHGHRDVWVVKLDVSGALQWQKPLGGSNSDLEPWIQETPDHGFILTSATASYDGDVSFNHNPGFYDYWVVKLEGMSTSLGAEHIAPFTIAPNPNHGTATITSQRPMTGTVLTLRDALGREILREPMLGQRVVLDLRDQPAGMYILTERSEQGSFSQRLVIE